MLRVDVPGQRLRATCNATAAPPPRLMAPVNPAASYSLTSDGIASSTSSRENSGSDTGQFRGREENTMPQECLGNF